MKSISILGLCMSLFLISCKSKSAATEGAEEKVKSSYNFEFSGQGNEPAWHVTITEDEIFYNSLVNQEGHRFTNVQRNPIMDVAGMSYSGTDNLGNSIKVDVFYQKCRDTMEEKVWPFRVSVELNVTDGEEAGENGIRGCGDYIEDRRLTGKWVLKTLKGKAITPLDKKGTPTVEFDTDKNTINSNMGCNGMGGSYEMMENTMYVSANFMSTMMFCKGVMELEKEFSSALAGKTLKVQFIEKSLVFTDLAGKEVITLKRK